MKVDLVALAAWNAGQQRAREAYAQGKATPVTSTCGCGRRTTDRSGRCRRCHAADTREQVTAT